MKVHGNAMFDLSGRDVNLGCLLVVTALRYSRELFFFRYHFDVLLLS